MKFVFDQDYHIHSQLSSCSRDPRQTPERLLQYALENGLTELCLTDHYWDSAVDGASSWYAPQNYEHICKSLPLPQSEGVRFFFGCECDMDKHRRIGLPLSRFDDFDMVVIPTTHLHMTGFTLTEEDAQSSAARARLWVERLEALLEMPLPFEKVGIAHLACPLLNRTSRGAYLETLDLIPSAEMERLFTKAAALGVGIELNVGDMKFTDEESDTVLRMFRIARDCGCRFYCASDAHHPESLASVKGIFQRAIDLLGLEESQKFRPKVR